jgi:hypothetical protein
VIFHVFSPFLNFLYTLFNAKAFKLFNLKEFINMDTELKAMAPAAIIGFNLGPPNRYNIPAAIGIPAVLYAKAQNRL